jgi:hypothetical protein
MVEARREFIIYLAFSVLLLAFDRTYAIFSHGVSSLSMTFMFLPVLLGGFVLVVLRAILKKRLVEHRLYRLFSFSFHSSIALLVNGMLVKGILEIAGTGSKYLFIFQYLAGLLSVMTMVVMFLIITSKREGNNR